MFYHLLALTKDRRDVVAFSLLDGPCMIGENQFVLVNRPGTPILRYDSIMRGMDIPGIFEGDIINYRGKDFIVKYQRGFNGYSLNGDVVDMNELSNGIVKSHVYFQDIFKQIAPTKIRYRIGNKHYTIDKVFSAPGRKGVVFNDKRLGIVELNRIEQDAGTIVNKKRIYFGKDAVMRKGKIIIKNLLNC